MAFTERDGYSGGGYDLGARKPVRDYYAIFKETLSVTATLTTLYLVLQQITK